jgi:hypothetical protein
VKKSGKNNSVSQKFIKNKKIDQKSDQKSEFQNVQKCTHNTTFSLKKMIKKSDKM